MAVSFFLALSLSLDALGVGLSYGLRQIRFPLLSRILLAAETAILLYFFLQMGTLLTQLFPPMLAELCGIGFLFGFGLFLCVQSFCKHPKSGSFFSFVRKPSACDTNHSAVLEPKEALLLGLVLSVDACGVGIGAGAASLTVSLLPVLAALLQTAFLALGSLLGKRFLQSNRMNEKQCGLLSGIIFLSIATMRLKQLL